MIDSVRDVRYEWFGIKSDEKRPSKIERCILNGVEVEYDTKDFVLYKEPPVKADPNDDDGVDDNPLHKEFLIYVGDGKNVRNPNGNISCYNMFTGYSGTQLDLSNFSTKNVKDMCNMFRECNNLQKLDLSNFDTSLVSRMDYMFCGCTSLREVNLSSFNTEKVESTAGMFWRCASLGELNLSSFNTTGFKATAHMFDDCESLQKLDLHNFELHCIYNMGDMFSGCSNLKELILPTYVDLSHIKCMTYLFCECYHLEKLDMSGFVNLESFKKGDIINDYDFWEGMFYDCRHLKYVYVTDEFLKVLNKIKDYRYSLSFDKCGDIKFINKKGMHEDIKNFSNDGDAYKYCKSAYNISDDDFMNILAEAKPCSPMITSFGKKVLIPQIQGMFDIRGGSSSLTVREVAKRLYNRYNKVIVDSALVLYLGDQYIVK